MEANRSSGVAGTAPEPSFLRLPLADWLAAARRLAMPAALVAALSAIVAVHAPVLGQYFFGDDFVPLGDIASQSTWSYIRETFLLRDTTPNWRFLTGLYYLAMFKAFGLNGTAFLLGSVLTQTATAALIFWLVWRVAGSAWAAALAALLFGVSAAPVPTVAYVTAFTHVLAGFLVMLAVVTLYEGLERRRLLVLGSASVVAYAGAIAANESVAFVAPVFVLLAFWKTADDGWWRRCATAALRSWPHIVLGAAALATFGACRCTDGPALLGFGDHILGNVWILLGRLLYPMGMEFPGRVGTAHMVAGPVAAALAAAALLRGPGLARISAAFLALALVPYAPTDWLLAPRHVHLASIPFSIMSALLVVELSRSAGRLWPSLAVALVVVAFGASGLLGWQTVEQNRTLAAASDDWRTLAEGLEHRYPDLPDGSRIYVRGGPLTDPLWQQYVMPALGHVLWGDVELRTVNESTGEFCARPGYRTYVVDYAGGSFDPVSDPRLVDCPQ